MPGEDTEISRERRTVPIPPQQAQVAVAAVSTFCYRSCPCCRLHRQLHRPLQIAAKAMWQR